MFKQFGWTTKGTFLVGAQEVTKVGAFFTNVTEEEIAKPYGSTGTVEQWKRAWDPFGDYEPWAFAMLTTFAAPLLNFYKQTGAILNVFNERHIGKSSLIDLLASAYGNPRQVPMRADTSLAERLHQMRVLRHLPVIIDGGELPKSKSFFDMLYAASNGRARSDVRDQLWQTIMVSTSTASFAEKIAAKRYWPMRTLVRLIEYKLEPIPQFDTFPLIYENYGHAGRIFVEYIIRNPEEVRSSCKQVRLKIERELNLKPREHFWSALASANIVAGMIAKRCNLISWPMGPIYLWALECIEAQRKIAPPPPLEPARLLNDFLNRYPDNILVVDDPPNTRHMATIKRRPAGETLIRFEVNVRKLYISARLFKLDCMRYKRRYSDILGEIKTSGRILWAGDKKMNAGTTIKDRRQPIHAIVFDIRGTDFVDYRDYLSCESKE